MGETTGIGWADSTFNCWIGCEKVSPGCARCYAETLVTGRMGRAGTWGTDGVRQRTSESLWKQPLRWERNAEAFQAERGHRRRVFCASLADVFEPRPELDLWRHDLLHLIYQTPSLDWLLLTKRPKVAREWLCCGNGVPQNVWLGVSIENSRFTWRADVLREIPAAVRFISAEPLLGSLLQSNITIVKMCPEHGHIDMSKPGRYPAWGNCAFGCGPRRALDLTGIDWLIVGGESGHGARPMEVEWARELRDACLAYPKGGLPHGEHPYDYGYERRTAFFFKQWGGRTPKAGGKLLDGREWCEFPTGAEALTPA